MEIICVINNYNYSRYLEECIDSVLSQTLPFNKIIVVDDGSTDNSPEIIRRYQDLNSKVIPILKANSGQLSCFNAAAEFIPDESQVFLLDSDDFFPKNYVEALSKKITFPTDFCFVTAVDFFEKSQQISNANIGDHENAVFPKTSAIIRKDGIPWWIGNVTSSISMSGVIYKKIIPYPFIEDWRSRADDVFVYISSLMGAEKVKVPSVGMAYRRHATSDSSNKNYLSKEIMESHNVAVSRLFEFYCEKFNIPRRPSFTEILPEYNLLNLPAREHLKCLGFRLF